VFEEFLAVLKFRLKATKLTGKDVISATDNNVALFVSSIHNFLPSLRLKLMI
jgi:hypothetical protein